ncbi:MAG TPA: PIG-L deacetylase family protein [Acidimicrobiales bacterium]|nr:PIG-L deacetylase family protein [Acidimicrobiales bacterium]
MALAIGAHPDDIEFGCAATLARWAANGCRVHHVVLTDGSKGSWDAATDPRELVRAREAECRAAAAVIDGREQSPVADDRVVFLAQVDGELHNDEDARRTLVGQLRRLQPEVVMAHDPWRRYRLHPDHRAAGFLSLDAVVAARDPLFYPDIGPAPHRPSCILLWEADEPNHVEDVAGFQEIKIAALLCHGSQAESTLGIPPSGKDSAAVDGFASKVRRQLAAHGSLASLPAGEAFHLMRP